MSLFVGCDNNNQGTNLVIVTLDSGVLGKEVETIDAFVDKSIILPSGENIWKTEAYSFSGWATTKDGEVAYKAGDKYSSSNNTLLYAVWTANPKITYNPNGATGDAITEYHKRGEEVTVRGTSFTKEDYTLSYWSTSPDATDTYIIGQEITLVEDLTLYAVWVENKDEIKITFNSGKLGKAEETTISTIEGNSIILPSGDSLWDTNAYTFSGWSTSESGEVSYNEGEKYSASSNITLYAVWSNNPTITYNPNGGVGDAIVETYKGGSKVTIKGPSFIKEGYTLSYWSTSANGTEVYTIGQKITLTKDLTLYARWAENEKSVTIKFNPGAMTDIPQTISVSEGNKIALPSGDNLWSVNGYTFSGWAETDKGDVKYKAGDTYSASSNCTLYAVWTQNMATLTYNANGGKGGIKSVKVAVGTEVTLEGEDSFSRDGYELDSWIDRNNGTYQPGGKLTLNEDITLYAVWTEKPNIKYYNEGVLIAIEYLQGNSAKIGDGNGLSKSDCALYWTTESNGTGTIYKVGDTYTGTQSLILYAQWDIASTYDIFYADQDGKDNPAGNPDEYTRYSKATNNNKPIVISNAPTRIGYIFKGWKLESETDDTKATRTYIIYAKTTGDVNLVEVWEKEEDEFKIYAITYEIGDGATAATGNPEEYIRYTEATSKNEPIVISGAPTKTGYVFKGWKVSGKTDDMAKTPYTIEASTMGNIKLEAVWGKVSKVGDIITFGTKDGRPITWKCIAYNTHIEQALMISEDILDSKVFGGSSYADSSIRRYLNGDFITKYNIDATKIVSIDLSKATETVNKFGYDGADKIFLLSKTEVESYLPNGSDRTAGGVWWLRTSESSKVGTYAYCVGSDGWISYIDPYYNTTFSKVRY